MKKKEEEKKEQQQQQRSGSFELGDYRFVLQSLNLLDQELLLVIELFLFCCRFVVSHNRDM